MRQSLQSKFNLLAVLLIVFFLLLLPMANQVKTDTKQSLQEARNTLMAQWTRALLKDIKPPKDLGDAEVEDYWAQQAREKNPNCGDACNPDADLDGDGVSNGEEYRNSKDPNCSDHCNPACNEDEKGVDFCKGQDPFKKPDDGNKTNPNLPRRFLINETIYEFGGSGAAKNCTTPFAGIATSCSTRSFNAIVNLSRMEVYVNVTQFSGVDWTMTVSGASGSPNWGGRSPACTPSPQCPPTGSYSGFYEAPNEGSYSINLRFNSQSAQSGKWVVLVYGVVS